MKLTAPLCLVSIAILVTACKPGRTIVGKWTTTAQGQTQSVEFTSDSKMLATISVSQPLQMTVTASGTYTLDNTVFNIKVSDVTFKATDSTKQALIDGFMSASVKKQQLDDINKRAANNKLVWKTDDEFTVSDATGQLQVFTRVKS